MKLRYTRRAKDDVESAFVWYEKQRRGLGFEFLDCVEIAVKSILENPEIYRIYYSLFKRICDKKISLFSILYN
jgi:toxin ParE1/3/4